MNPQAYLDTIANDAKLRSRMTDEQSKPIIDALQNVIRVIAPYVRDDGTMKVITDSLSFALRLANDRVK